VRASQPSARSRSTTGLVVRTIICIGCGLGSLKSPALAQVPAPTPEFQSEPIQPWQASKPVEFRQPRPDAFDKPIPGHSALAKPGNEGAGQEMNGDVETQVLLPLLVEEKRLLVDYGPDHPDVRSIRERIQMVREHLAQHPPPPSPTILAPLPPISVRTSDQEVPSTTASTSSSPRQTQPVPLPPMRSQSLHPGGTHDGTAAKDRDRNTQTMTSTSRTELIRPAGFSNAGNPIRDSGTAPVSLAAPPPTVGETKDKDPHPPASDSTNPSGQTVVSPPRSVGAHSASQPSQEPPRGDSFFETGFGQLIGIVGAVLLGVLLHLIALVLILRRYSAHLARVSRVELVNPTAVGLVGEEPATGAPTVAAAPATREVTPSSTAGTLDIAPIYAEEMRQKQETLDQQEQAVLRHIFELNMQMREQLGQFSGAAV
jgi:hypothetical protein